jgi:hypothetical protein
MRRSNGGFPSSSSFKKTSMSNLLQTDHKEHINVLPNEITVSTEQRTKEKEKKKQLVLCIYITRNR